MGFFWRVAGVLRLGGYRDFFCGIRSREFNRFVFKIIGCSFRGLGLEFCESLQGFFFEFWELFFFFSSFYEQSLFFRFFEFGFSRSEKEGRGCGVGFQVLEFGRELSFVEVSFVGIIRVLVIRFMRCQYSRMRERFEKGFLRGQQGV